jgi:hypothetical protein
MLVVRRTRMTFASPRGQRLTTGYHLGPGIDPRLTAVIVQHGIHYGDRVSATLPAAGTGYSE